jgi:hypothetical protein
MDRIAAAVNSSQTARLGRMVSIMAGSSLMTGWPANAREESIEQENTRKTIPKR